MQNRLYADVFLSYAIHLLDYMRHEKDTAKTTKKRTKKKKQKDKEKYYMKIIRTRISIRSIHQK